MCNHKCHIFNSQRPNIWFDLFFRMVIKCMIAVISLAITSYKSCCIAVLVLIPKLLNIKLNMLRLRNNRRNVFPKKSSLDSLIQCLLIF